MKRVIRLSPHLHSGRQLPHHHTSYGALAILLVFLGVIMALVTSGLYRPGQAASGDITVTGVVPGPPPQTAPSITAPTQGQRFTASPIKVEGSCLAGMVVVISRNNVDSGSAVCQPNATFALTIDLFPGRNDLVARQYDSLNQVSPSSPPVTVYLVQPSAPGTVNIQPVPAAALLVIHTEYRYSGIYTGRKFSLPIEITGGQPPYAVSIDWGEGQSSLVSRPQAGTYRYDHVYTKPGTYTVLIKASDVKGGDAHYQTVVYVRDLVVIAPTQEPALPSGGGQLLVAWPLYIAILGLTVGFGLGDAYGHFEAKNEEESSPQLAPPTP